MRNIKAWTSMALAAALAFSLAGCGASEMSGSSAAASEAETTEDAAAAGELGETENPESGEESGTRVIVDHTGAEIEIPAEIDRIVISSILPLPSVYCLFEGSAEKLVGMHPSSMQQRTRFFRRSCRTFWTSTPTSFWAARSTWRNL